MDNLIYEILNLDIQYLTDYINMNYKDTKPFIPNVNLIHNIVQKEGQENNLGDIDKFLYKRNIINLLTNQKDIGLYILIDPTNNCKNFHRIIRVLKSDTLIFLRPNEYRCKIKGNEYIIEIEILPINDSWRFN